MRMNDLSGETSRLARLLVRRLERLSADSAWAHRASGVRGALLRWLDSPSPKEDPAAWISEGFRILELAAKETPGDDLAS